MTTSTAPIPGETTATTPVQAAKKAVATPTQWAIYCDYKYNDVLRANKCRWQPLAGCDCLERCPRAWVTTSSAVAKKLRDLSSEIEVIPVEEAIKRWNQDHPIYVLKQRNTYQHRQALKALGCRWVQHGKVWCALSPEMKEQALRILTPILFATAEEVAATKHVTIVDPTLQPRVMLNYVEAGDLLTDPEKRERHAFMVVGRPRLIEELAPAGFILNEALGRWEVQTVLVQH